MVFTTRARKTIEQAPVHLHEEGTKFEELQFIGTYVVLIIECGGLDIHQYLFLGNQSSIVYNPMHEQLFLVVHSIS